ncbi:putative phospholipase B-like 2 isoform X2 [Amblyomma americanum]
MHSNMVIGALTFLVAFVPMAWSLEGWVKLNQEPTSFEVGLGPRMKNHTHAAWGSIYNLMNETGFIYVEVYTNKSLPDDHQAYAAGLFEGVFAEKLIGMHFRNQWTDYCANETVYCKKLFHFLNENLHYLNEQAAKYGSTIPYWHQVDLVLLQLAGIDDGRTGRTIHHFPTWSYLNATDTLLLNLHGDIQDLEAALNRRVMSRVTGDGSCSALVKVVPGNNDLYFSHVTWTKYSSMLRMLKKYTFGYHKTSGSREFIPGQTVTFSSYPGRIFSGDDFYLISSGLATMETTLGNENPLLYLYVKPESTLAFMRNIVANRLATTGKEWTDIFAMDNSGTYNNQWMVVDYKKFKPGQPLPDGLLYVLEQLPHYINVTDATHVLREKTYWASYNVPYFEFIFNVSGWWPLVEKYGDWFTYDRTPRALMFKRDHSKVQDMDSMVRLMRYNDYKNDPLSRCNCTPPYSAENAISARSDLNPENGTYPFPSLGHRAHGGTDMKLTNTSLFARLEFMAVSGPTWDQQPPFQWSTSGLKERHEGQPDLWKFTPSVHHWGSGMEENEERGR